MHQAAAIPEGLVSRSDDAWMARCRRPARIGEFSAILRRRGRPHEILIDHETCFELPPDLMQADWDRLRPGDLVCVRVLDRPGLLPLAASVDSLDGGFAVASRILFDAAQP